MAKAPYLSIIIPALNEGKYIGKLLGSIKESTYKDYEVIVVDGNSKDNTREVAKKAGAKVLSEPIGKYSHPGIARNIGADEADGELFAFFDADAWFDKDFLERSIAEFEKRGLVSATSKNSPSVKGIGAKLSMGFYNSYLRFFERTKAPRAPGYSMFIKADVFRKIGGFDPKLKLAEDHDLMKRSLAHGRFGVLEPGIMVSLRRYDQTNKLTLLGRMLWVEWMLLLGRRIERTNFNYEFGKFKGGH